MDRNQRAVEEFKEADFNKRVEGFMKEYKALTDKWEVDYIQFPQYVPYDDKKGFLTTIQNMPVDLRLKKLNDSFLSK